MSISVESFEYLLEESLSQTTMLRGSLIQATVVGLMGDRVILNAGLKSDSVLPLAEFAGAELAIGDVVEVMLESVENGWGETKLSREKAIRAKAWAVIQESFDKEEVVIGRIIDRVKGGFTVELDGVRAFLPGSLVDVKPVRDPSYLENQDLEFKVIKMDQKRNNVVVSRKAVMEAGSSEEQIARLEQLQEGEEVEGVVKNITDYGAFVDLGGIDGLLHITDMSWKRVKHPSDLVNVGDEVKVKVLRFDRDKRRVSLGLKQMGDDPWKKIEARYPLELRVRGCVTNITDYGCFVELEEGVEGLVHMSEMDWTNKNVHPSRIVSIGEELDVMILDIDGDRRRISLGMKQCRDNPWHSFADTHKVGDRVHGSIRSITDFGIFVGLDGSIDGLVHLSDLSWSEAGEVASRNYKKGDEVDAVILGIDVERERISLGIKQLESNPIDDFIKANDAKAVEVEVTKVLAKSATVNCGEDLTGVLKIAEYSHDRASDLRDILNVGDKIDVKILGSDPKYGLLVSKKALEQSPIEAQAAKTKSVPKNTTLGDLLKEQMNQKGE